MVISPPHAKWGACRVRIWVGICNAVLHCCACMTMWLPRSNASIAMDGQQILVVYSAFRLSQTTWTCPEAF